MLVDRAYCRDVILVSTPFPFARPRSANVGMVATKEGGGTLGQFEGLASADSLENCAIMFSSSEVEISSPSEESSHSKSFCRFPDFSSSRRSFQSEAQMLGIWQEVPQSPQKN